MDIINVLAQELSIRTQQAKAAVTLLDEGNTVPFIARYRKEMTGSLNDEQLRDLCDRLNYLRNLEEKKEQVIKSIEEQGKMTPALHKQIEEAQTLVAVDDLYMPYRPKRRTRAMIAKERGLEPLAQAVAAQKNGDDPYVLAAAYIDPEKEVPDEESALAGAMDILAEMIAEQAQIRAWVRTTTFREGMIASSAKNPDESTVYDVYKEYSEPVAKAAGHRILALNRGEKEKILTVKVEAPDEMIIRWIETKVIRGKNEKCTQLLRSMCEDSYRRLIAPAVERDIRNELTEKAQNGAIDVFGKNLRQLLMQPPVVGRTVLGWDPAFRTGCKLAVADPSGKVLDTVVIYPTAPTTPAKMAAAEAMLDKLIDRYHVTVISVGNGTASRESESFIAEYLKKSGRKDVHYVIVSEAGASVYSASKLATEEFPNFDVGQRSAASIARRLQDPLAELVKIDPKAIGVGQYQHDLNQKRLSETLNGVVEDCVNAVGVDLNTASAVLLEQISGISKSVASNIVAYREANGRFRDRRELMKVPKLGAKAFEQCAGFTRIIGGKEPLDQTAVHPESYDAARAVLSSCKISPEEITRGGREGLSRMIGDFTKKAKELGIGEITLRDIVSELEKPGRDPRCAMPGPILRSDVLEMKDLKPGMLLKGTVRNVIDFGAFIDIGVHQDGLVHISQMSANRFVKHPMDVVSIGDVVDVKVLSVDLQKKRISLTMKTEENTK